MDYEQLQKLSDENFRRLTGVKQDFAYHELINCMEIHLFYAQIK